MSKRKTNEPELLPGADAEADCQPATALEAAFAPAEISSPADEQDDDHEHAIRWDSLESTPRHAGGAPAPSPWLHGRPTWARRLESVALAVEKPVNRLTGTTQLNPFYHTGTIAVFLLVLVGLTGVYLFLFFQYGFDASYTAVTNRIETPFIARVIRAVHRYASGSLVIVTLLHAYRTLFMVRFRGPRWLAWVTGIVMTFFVWLAGVTGYWLVWDTRSQLITRSFLDFLQSVTPFGPAFAVLLDTAETTGVSWPILLGILAVHVLLFVALAVFFWLHIKRLKRPRWLPDMLWVALIGAVVLVVSAFFPLGMLPQADSARLPGAVSLDPLFLFYLPLANRPLLNALLWIALFAITAVGLVLPWLRGRRTEVAAVDENVSSIGPRPQSLPVHIIKDRCTGCTKCAVDCPYGAIDMVERHDGKPHKFIAIEDPALCVSCGICVGSCDGVAVTLGNTRPELLWDHVAMQLVLARAAQPAGPLDVVFTCERHAAHNQDMFANGSTPAGAATLASGRTVIALPCVGTAPPDLLTRTLQAGADHVRVIGCPPDDCVNREGNLFTAQRLTRERLPRLKRAYANAPITAAWVPPDDFRSGLDPAVPSNDDGQPDYLLQRELYKTLTARNLLPGLLLLTLLFALQVVLTRLPYTPPAQPPVLAEIVLADVGQSVPATGYLSTRLSPELVLELTVDGRTAVAQTFATTDLQTDSTMPVYLEQPLEPGAQHVRLALIDAAAGIDFVLFDRAVMLEPGDILRIGP